MGTRGGNFESLVPSTDKAVTTVTDTIDDTGLSLSATGTVAKVGKQKVSQQEWDNAHRNFVERQRSQRPDLDISLFDQPEVKQQSLDALIREYVLLMAANDQHLTVPAGAFLF